jgi:hypothetical protein
MLDGIFNHLLHGGVIDIDGGFHFDDFLLAGFGVAGENMQDAAGVDLELHSDPRDTLGGALEVNREPAEAPVVLRAFAFTLEDVDQHVALMVDGGGEHLAGLYGNGRVARNDDIHQATESLQAERERRNIKQQNIFETAGENFCLDGRAEGDGLVGVLRGIEFRSERL